MPSSLLAKLTGKKPAAAASAAAAPDSLADDQDELQDGSDSIFSSIKRAVKGKRAGLSKDSAHQSLLLDGGDGQLIANEDEQEDHDFAVDVARADIASSGAQAAVSTGANQLLPGLGTALSTAKAVGQKGKSAAKASKLASHMSAAAAAGPMEDVPLMSPAATIAPDSAAAIAPALSSLASIKKGQVATAAAGPIVPTALSELVRGKAQAQESDDVRSLLTQLGNDEDTPEASAVASQVHEILADSDPKKAAAAGKSRAFANSLI